MFGHGSSVFTDVDDYEAALPAEVDLLPAVPGGFRTRLSWVELPHVKLLSVKEASAGLAFASLPSTCIAIVFPTDPASSLICDGIPLQRNDMVFHSLGSRFHQRTTASCRWGCVCLSPDALMKYGRILTGQDIAPPSYRRVLRLAAGDRRRLVRLHAKVFRIASTEPDSIRHPEVTRALDQDLLWALVTCLENGRPPDVPVGCRRCAGILADLRDALTAGRLLHVRDACRAIGVSERTLRSCCSGVLGMSASRYMSLQRLKQTRRALLHCDGAPGPVADVISRYGFTDPRRFTAAYQQAFGRVVWPETGLDR